ncbi:hypothetical protein [uncultured Mycobacterium sp.]
MRAAERREEKPGHQTQPGADARRGAPGGEAGPSDPADAARHHRQRAHT